MRKALSIVLSLLLVFTATAFATVSQFPGGIATDDIYDYNTGTGWVGTYKMSLPTLTANDTLCGIATTQTLTNKTLTSPTITGASLSSATLTSPTITSGAINAATLTTVKINDTSADHIYTIGVSELAANRTITLPLAAANDTFVLADQTQTLTAKTLVSAAMNAPVITQTISAHTSSGNIVAADAGKIITNAGAGANITLTLPEASTVIGKTFCFQSAANFAILIDVDNADQIQRLTTGAGNMIASTATAYAEAICLTALDAASFVALTKEVGTWSEN